MPLVINLTAAVATILLRKVLRNFSSNVVVAHQSAFLSPHLLGLCFIGTAICYLIRNKYRKRRNETGGQMLQHEQCHRLQGNPIVKAKFRLENSNSHSNEVSLRRANDILHLAKETLNSEPFEQNKATPTRCRYYLRSKKSKLEKPLLDRSHSLP